MVVQRRYGRVQDVLDLLSYEDDEIAAERLYDEHAAERSESADLLRRLTELLRTTLSVPAAASTDGARDLDVAATHGYVLRFGEQGDLDVSTGDIRILLKKPWGEGFGLVPGSTRFGSVEAFVRTRRGERRRRTGTTAGFYVAATSRSSEQSTRRWRSSGKGVESGGSRRISRIRATACIAENCG